MENSYNFQLDYQQWNITKFFLACLCVTQGTHIKIVKQNFSGETKKKYIQELK